MGPAGCQIACKQVLSIQTFFIHLTGSGRVDERVQIPNSLRYHYLSLLSVTGYGCRVIFSIRSALVYAVLWFWKTKVF
jgi:hypothetical protein